MSPLMNIAVLGRVCYEQDCETDGVFGKNLDKHFQCVDSF